MRKKQKKHAEMLSELKAGDRVVTNGGIFGTVVGVTDSIVQLRIADQVKGYMENASLPEGVEMSFWSDSSKIVKGRLHTLLDSFWKSMLFVFVACGLLVVEPDLGAATVLLCATLGVMFIAGVRLRYFILAAATAVAGIMALILTSEYRRARLTGFRDPWADPQDTGYQLTQSLIAIGSGGIWGVGLGQSGQKLQFLPLANSDFIYAILGEELGLVGGAAVLVLFLLVGWRALRAGHRAPDHFGRFLAWGLCALILLQALIHASITLQLLPVTGTPLPLISYGGTAMMSNLVACGLLLNVSQHGV